MYAGGAPVGGTASAQAEDKEAYLLGKKRVDSFVEQGNTVEEVSFRVDALNKSCRVRMCLVGIRMPCMDCKPIPHETLKIKSEKIPC